VDQKLVVVYFEECGKWWFVGTGLVDAVVVELVSAMD